MSLIKKILSYLTILCAVGCSNTDEQERQELLKWLDHHISQLSKQIAADIEKEKQGFFAHEGKDEYHSKGFIEYVLREKSGKRLEVSQHSLLTTDDIVNTDGYKQLLAEAARHHSNVSLKAVTIDGDEIESYEEIDEYIDNQEHYFVIKVSGW
jgi:hypothetical protein